MSLANDLPRPPVPPAAGALDRTTRSWPARRTALVLAGVAQFVAITVLAGTDPVAATWGALLLAIAPFPVNLLAAYAPAAKFAVPLATVVIVVGMAVQFGHAGMFFIPALIALIVANLRLWGPSRPTPVPAVAG